MRKLLLVSTLLAVVCSLTASLAEAQTFQGGLRGTVKDAQGVIPGVTVTLTNEATGTSRDTVTNDAGGFSFPALDPGNYAIKAAVAGFKSFERRGIRISTQTFVTLDVTLEVGALEETITVTADAPLIETSNASHADVLDAKTLETLPSVGRNVFLMAVTVPTVQSSGDTHWNRMQDQTGASALSMGGGGVRANNYLLDGFPVTDLQNRSSTNPSGEMIEDIRVQVHTYDAEMGRTGGGVFNTTARSGTNTYRGSAFFLSRPTALVGPNFFNEIRDVPTNDQYWRNGGGGVGGPILRNKTFFWFAAEAYEDGQSQNNTLHFPTTAMRRGDFSGLTDLQGRPVIIYDPSTTDANGNRQPFAGNIIPSNRISPVGQQMVNSLPVPAGNTDNSSPNYNGQDIIKSIAKQMSFKVDHQFTNDISLSGVYLFQDSSEPDANYFPEAPYAAPSYQLDRVINVFVLNNTYIVNPTTVATFRFGMNTFDDDNSLPFGYDSDQLWGRSAPQFAAAIPVKKFPSLTLTGYNGTGFTGEADREYYSWGVNGSLTKLAGSHSVKIGADYRILGVDALAHGQSAGSYTFSGQFSSINSSNRGNTGNAIADLLLGYPSSGNITLNSRFNDYIKYYGGFVQDDWRVTDRLTVNYGLRLEHESGLAEENDQLVVAFDRNAVSPLNVTIPADPVAGTPARQVMGGLLYAGQNGAPSSVGDPPAVKLSPRAGFAYSLNQQTVVRGGYGLFWAPWSSGVEQSAGYSATTDLQQDAQRPITSIDNPFPALAPISGNANGLLTGVSANVSFIDPDRDAPRVHQYSVDMQRQLPGDMSVGVTYMGATGRHLTWGTTVNINQVDPRYIGLNNVNGTNLLLQNVTNPFLGNPNAGAFAARTTLPRNQLLRPFPQFGNITMSQSTLGKSQYHAAVIALTKRTTGWWGGRVSYTWSRLDDNQFGQGNYYSSAPGLLNAYTAIPWSDYFNPDAEYGRSLLDSPHKLVASPIIRLPFGDGQRWLTSGVGDMLAGGWTLSFVIQMQSGFPIGVSQSNNNTNLLGSNQRPNLVSGVDARTDGSITERLEANPNDSLYLNPAAFTEAPAGTFGNSPRLLPGVYSPWRNSTDMRIRKDIGFGGNRRLSVDFEVINVFDNPWYAALGSVAYSPTSGTFGRVTAQANYSRTMQFTARFSF